MIRIIRGDPGHGVAAIGAAYYDAFHRCRFAFGGVSPAEPPGQRTDSPAWLGLSLLRSTRAVTSLSDWRTSRATMRGHSRRSVIRFPKPVVPSGEVMTTSFEVACVEVCNANDSP